MTVSTVFDVQVRHHAMFSEEGRSLDEDTLEYAWLVEVQLGKLSGKLTAPQVCIGFPFPCSCLKHHFLITRVFKGACLFSVLVHSCTILSLVWKHL